MGRLSDHAPGRFERAVVYTRKLLAGEPLSVAIILGIYQMGRTTAKRDLLDLERTLPVRRERGVVRLARSGE